jgi:hypothetical protein
MRRGRGVATEIQGFYGKSIAGTESTAYIVHATYIIQYYNNRVFIGCVYLGNG